MCNRAARGITNLGPERETPPTPTRAAPTVTIRDREAVAHVRAVRATLTSRIFRSRWSGAEEIASDFAAVIARLRRDPVVGSRSWIATECDDRQVEQTFIESLGLASNNSWAATALASCLDTCSRISDPYVTIIDAALRGDESFHVLYRRNHPDFPIDWVLGTSGGRDPRATLLLMPHIEASEVPLDPERYGRDFALVGLIEPFGSKDYAEPDQDGIRWFVPTDYRKSLGTD